MPAGPGPILSESPLSDLLLVCRLTLICVLAVAGIAKLRDRRRFATALGDLTYLPAAARPTLAVLVPAAELIAAALLALPRTLTAGLAVAAAMCAAFSAVAVTTMRSGSSAGCPCFGSRTTVPMAPGMSPATPHSPFSPCSAAPSPSSTAPPPPSTPPHSRSPSPSISPRSPSSPTTSPSSSRSAPADAERTITE
ncbi:MauE/DoxX family redox-associated membrane protein [Streptomyces sp. NPDC056358]|uniref:MauE/DoxX family redox-associated membrane protein n=1 Tax=Streptomyces sp. NPDC056358 TaxID=3345794 RepID=UPI0035D96D44